MNASKVETLNELKIWLDGKFDLVAQSQKAAGEDIVTLRRTLHDVSNSVAALTILDIPRKFSDLAKSVVKHDDDLAAIVKENAAKAAALRFLKSLYFIGGGLLGAIIGISLEVYKVLH